MSGSGGCYEMIDGVAVLVEPPTKPAPEPGSAGEDNRNTEFAPGDAVAPPAGTGAKSGRGGPSTASPATRNLKE